MSSSWHITCDIPVIVSAAEQPETRLLSILKCNSHKFCHVGNFRVQHPAWCWWSCSESDSVCFCVPDALCVFQLCFGCPWCVTLSTAWFQSCAAVLVLSSVRTDGNGSAAGSLWVVAGVKLRKGLPHCAEPNCSLSLEFALIFPFFSILLHTSNGSFSSFFHIERFAPVF